MQKMKLELTILDPLWTYNKQQLFDKAIRQMSNLEIASSVQK